MTSEQVDEFLDSLDAVVEVILVHSHPLAHDAQTIRALRVEQASADERHHPGGLKVADVHHSLVDLTEVNISGLALMRVVTSWSTEGSTA